MKQPAENAINNVIAMPSPDTSGHQVSYEFGTSRRVHAFTKASSSAEEPPHGAGSFHDPEQHQALMDRIETYLKNTRS